MGLNKEDWEFLEESGIGLRHIGSDEVLRQQFAPGGMVGDAAPLSMAAKIIQRERTGADHNAEMSYGFAQALGNDLGNDTEDFNARLREKLRQIVGPSVKLHSDTHDGNSSTFMLVRDMDRFYDNGEYEKGGYPLGKIGRNDLNPVRPQNIVSVLRLDDNDRQEIAAGRRDSTEIFVDKILDAIPATRQRLAFSDDPAPPPAILTSAPVTSAPAAPAVAIPVMARPPEDDEYGRAAPAAPAAPAREARYQDEKISDIEKAGGRKFEDMSPALRILSVVALEAQRFADGVVPAGEKESQADCFKTNLNLFVLQDPVMAANFCASVLNQPNLGELATRTQSAYGDALKELVKNDPDRAGIVARSTLTAYAGNPAIEGVFKQIPELAHISPAKPEPQAHAAPQRHSAFAAPMRPR